MMINIYVSMSKECYQMLIVYTNDEDRVLPKDSLPQGI